MKSALRHAREFFSVARAGAVSEESRERFAHELSLARQKREAARILLRNGARAESLAVAVQAFSLAKAAATQVEPHDATTRLVAAANDALALPFAELDERFGAADEETLELTLAATAALDSDLADAALPSSARTRVRLARAVSVIALASVAMFAVRWAAKRPPHLTADASASHGPDYIPYRAIDGDEPTEWLLPDKTPGWLEVAPIRPVTFERITLLNCRNPGGSERATGDFSVEVFSHGKVVKTENRTFPPYDKQQHWMTIELGTSEPVDKIRITVKTWQGEGGGIAELRVE